MVEILNPNGGFPCLLVCDHASSSLPDEYKNLGLQPNALEKHIAVDIGIDAVVRTLSDLLDAPAVLAQHSRLLIDTNRWIADPQSTPEVSDNVVVPGNLHISEQERRLRHERYFWPFHTAIAEYVRALGQRHAKPAFFALHSCTRAMSTGPARAMDGGTIWHEQPRFANSIAHALRSDFSLNITDNQPYSGIGGTAFTIDYHTWGTGIEACGFEILNDLIGTPTDQEKWASFLATALRSACA